jgi:hypothetical protein
MGWLVSIDPGIRGCGFALWENATLRYGAYVPSACTKDNGPEACLAMAEALCNVMHARWPLYAVHECKVMVEWPRIYSTQAKKGDKAKADPNDLLGLVGVDMAFLGMLKGPLENRFSRVYPEQWKGQLPKETADGSNPVMMRVLKRLSVQEKAAIAPCSRSLEHNMFDALGIGLHALGRFERERIFAR